MNSSTDDITPDHFIENVNVSTAAQTHVMCHITLLLTGNQPSTNQATVAAEYDYFCFSVVLV